MTDFFYLLAAKLATFAALFASLFIAGVVLRACWIVFMFGWRLL